MSQSRQPIEISNFSKGILTEISPLNFPPEATRDERNFILNNNGTRTRRLGMDFEPNRILHDTGLTKLEVDEAAFNTFKWEDAGEILGQDILVVQAAKTLYFFNGNTTTNSDTVVSVQGLSSTQDTKVIVAAADDNSTIFDFTIIDGMLVVTTGLSKPLLFEAQQVFDVDFNSSLLVVQSNEVGELKVRDIWGIEDELPVTVEGEIGPFANSHIDRGANINYRPHINVVGGLATLDTQTQKHLYNLYNQGWPQETTWLFADGDGDSKLPDCESMTAASNWIGANVAFELDPLNTHTLLEEGARWPSNADTYSLFLTFGDESPAEVEAFGYKAMTGGEGLNYHSPKGRFIIDLFNRGSSRLEQTNKAVVYTVSELPEDRTTVYSEQDSTASAGLNCITQFAGRVFYSGIRGSVLNGDDRSPRLDSYVVFSQVVNYPSQISQCYQEADPTSKEDSALVATDGGLIRLSGAIGINRMEELNDTLVIFADNGVWQVLGSSDYGFTAEEYRVLRVSTFGCISKNSVVNVGDALLYWSDSGIHVIQQSPESGLATEQSLSETTINTLYDAIPNKDKSIGMFDTFEAKVHWVYGDNKELIFDVRKKAFTMNEVESYAGTDLDVGKTSLSSCLLSVFKGAAYSTTYTDDIVIDEGGNIVEDINLNIITTTERIIARKQKAESKYLVLILGDDNDSTYFSFCNYTDTEFKDWSDNGAQDGQDAPAYMLFGALSGGETQRQKQVPYAHFHFNKTETGFEGSTGDILAVGESSCLVQVQWNFTNSISSNKWSPSFQAYRHKRLWMPEDVDSIYDDGQEVITTKNKLRGRGRSLSLLVETEPLKDCQLLGWAMDMNINNAV